MAKQRLFGNQAAEDEAAAQDRASLGPSDSSDSGSDLIGIRAHDADDPWAPVDVVLREDRPHPLAPPDLPGAAPAADIGIDRVVDAGELAALDAEASPVETEVDDEGVQLALGLEIDDEDPLEAEDEYLDEVTAAMPRKPNPEPDPLPPPPGGGEPLEGPVDEPGDDDEDRHAGRRPPSPSPAARR
jgi:hypothetical protein